jgi:alpha-1,3/alpha-1,6-mannosyltransferase
MYTSHYSPARSFYETRDGSFPVIVHGDWLPRTTFGGFSIVWAICRAIWLALCIWWSGIKYDVFITDQISVYNIVLRVLRPGSKIVFYCHFPDQLLASRGTCLKRFYRAPFDALESWSTGLAHVVAVNSKFTKRTFHQTFPRLARQDPVVLYPCVAIDSTQKYVGM